MEACRIHPWVALPVGGFLQPPGARTGWGGTVWGGAIISHKSHSGPWVPICSGDKTPRTQFLRARGSPGSPESDSIFRGDFEPRESEFSDQNPQEPRGQYWRGWTEVVLGTATCTTASPRFLPPPPSSFPTQRHHIWKEGKRELIYKSHTWGRSWRVSSALCRPGPALQPSPLPSLMGLILQSSRRSEGTVGGPQRSKG